MATLKLVVTGGAGQIAYSLIPLIARGLVFGPGVRVHLRLLDIPPAANALDGVAMEIQDSLFSTVLDGVLATTDEGKAFEGAEVAILLGGFPRRPGMERGDLIGKNAGIMKKMGQALERYADHGCKVVVVANPAPTNCVVLSSHAPSIPRKNITCLSRLDHDRMIGMLLAEANRLLSLQDDNSAGGNGSGGGAGARERKLGPADIRGACVWGNHSNSQVPDVSSAELFIGNMWVPAVFAFRDAHLLGLNAPRPGSAPTGEGEVCSLTKAVRGRGAAVLEARKLSSAMSAANAIAGHLSDWLVPAAVSDSPSTAVSMGVPTDGNPFGVPEGLFCSLPVHCRGDGEWAFAEKYRLPCEGERQLDASIEELREEKAMVSEMLGEGMAAGGAPTPSSPASAVAPAQSSATPTSNL
eukprot:jgi/Undpi1/6980/HiC_scaffold_21.g09454.m1